MGKPFFQEGVEGFALRGIIGKSRRHRMPAAGLKQAHLSCGDDRGAKINARDGSA